MSATKAFPIVLIETWANLLISQDYRRNTQREITFLCQYFLFYPWKTWCNVSELYTTAARWMGLLDSPQYSATETDKERHTEFGLSSLISISGYGHFLHSIFFTGSFLLPVICIGVRWCSWPWSLQQWPCAAHVGGGLSRAGEQQAIGCLHRSQL